MNDAVIAYVLRRNWPDDGAYVLSPQELRQYVETAFRDGYLAGRERALPPLETEGTS
jgi:hypothetical protein